MSATWAPTPTDAEFEAFRALVKAACGISLSDSKRPLLAARLARRLRHYGYTTFGEYHEHLCRMDAGGSELRTMVNCITTNKTSFFREPHHFGFLRDRVIPSLRARGTRRVRIWSAGCSTGEEAYSIAAVLATTLGPGWDARVLASDIDTEVLARASEGVYPLDALDSVPHDLQRNFEVGPDGARVRSAARSLVTFRRINLIEQPWPIHTRFDAIFCRNVTIYFDRATQRRLYERFVGYLEPQGHFFAGHSENLHWLPDLFSLVGETVYRPAPNAATKDVRDVVIRSGELHASAAPSLVRTLLGSCVAACVFDPERRVGGMNHFMLAHGSREGSPALFGPDAMSTLVRQLLESGASRGRLRAKIFGGARVLAPAAGSIADDNVRFAREFLAGEGIPIVAERVGGDQAIQVHFETHTGRALVRTTARRTEAA